MHHRPRAAGTPADIYALGAVGYFLVTGRQLFEGKTALDICIQHVTAAPTPPSHHAPHLAKELEAVILACLAKSPKDRPASARDLAARLRAVPGSQAWSETDAARWWRDFKAAPTVLSTTGTLTVTVDLHERHVVSRRA